MTAPALPGTDVIDVAQFQQLRSADPDIRILDVRTGGEFETVHIPGSYNVPLDTLGEHVRDLASVEHPVVLVCQSGGRATQAHGKLTSAGKDKLHILEGGMNAWTAADGDVIRGENDRWELEREVRFVDGLIVLTAMLLSLVVPGLQWIAAGVGAGLVFAAVTNTWAGGAGNTRVNQRASHSCMRCSAASRSSSPSASPCDRDVPDVRMQCPATATSSACRRSHSSSAGW